MQKLTKREATEIWRSCNLEVLKKVHEKDGRIDIPLRNENWANFTDMLCKNGQITMKQYESWVAPKECR